jgi:hypothetical protein
MLPACRGCLSPTVTPVGASSADTQERMEYFISRGEVGTSLLILFGDPKRRFLVLGIARTEILFIFI